jgi:hypothetical protein
MLSEFEADLIKLQWIWYRLQAIYVFSPKIPLDNQADNLFSSVVREMIMIQLHNFVIVRKKLCKNEEFRDLDSCLDLLWKPIMEKAEAIKLIRNNYIAHIQEKIKSFDLMIQEIVEKYQLSTSFGDWVFLAGCANFYSGIVNVNFKEKITNALAKYDAQAPLLTKYHKYTMKTYKQAFRKILLQTRCKLMEKGFKMVGT